MKDIKMVKVRHQQKRITPRNVCFGAMFCVRHQHNVMGIDIDKAMERP